MIAFANQTSTIIDKALAITIISISTSLTYSGLFENASVYGSDTSTDVPLDEACSILESDLLIVPNSYDPDYPPENAVDNDFNSLWARKDSNTSITLDLGDSKKKICAVNVAWNDGHRGIYDFSIQGSIDGRSFIDLFSGSSTGESSSLESYDIDDLNVRFVKIAIFNEPEFLTADRGTSIAGI